jgi:formylglycine-generating enzyme required for sulfatase activity/predicted Ser/Thr protein kinase
VPESSSGPEQARFLRAKEILHQALEREESARDAWVGEACVGDTELADEVRSLLAFHDPDDDFLEEPPALVASVAERESEPAAIPERIGNFRIVRLLGWGGMGVVYLAEQDQPRRQVALKVLRLDCASEHARLRFEREAQALARLQHPGIAQIYETGVARTDVGPQPYFAMEYVDGVSIREFCRTQDLSLAARFRLVADVCDAVQHAHERGVLHRDLKPDNILIDTRGAPRVLDFGVARITGEGGQESFHTLTGQILGTVAYMSPEQARGAEVDERCDQFSLGVILYELLSGRLPFETRGYSVARLMRTVAEEAPFPIAAVNPELGGDAATIVHKALDPDPARRYASVEGLAADIRRYLEGRPIHARPPTTLYQFKKLVTRHRALAFSLAGVFLALALGLGFALHGMREARAAVKLARLESDLVLRLSHVQLLEELRAREQELWPPGPELVDDIDAWLADADELQSHIPNHERHLTEADSYARDGRLDEFLSGGTRVHGGAEWFYGMLQSLVDELHAFYSEDDGLVSEIRERRRLSTELRALTIDDHRGEWERSIEGIRRSSLYAGLVIEPQLGLVPLGADPDSGLFEFAHYGQTGTIPVRDAVSGKLGLCEDTAIVFVLVPGGKVLIGVQSEDPEAPNYSSVDRFHEGPPRVFDLAPYFIAKYEVTQAQWLRLGEVNNSHWAIGEDPECGVINGLHPVEMVNWTEAHGFLRKLACTLPTEAQWECAARAGTTTPWWFGSDWRELKGRANLVNKPRMDGRRDPIARPRQSEDWDPWTVHAPAGSFPANPYGIHDVLGNVAEWCLDGYKVDYFDLRVRAGDGLVLADGGGDYSIRGGSFYHQPRLARVGHREEKRAYDRKRTHGFRAARSVAGEWRRERDQAELRSPAGSSGR